MKSKKTSVLVLSAIVAMLDVVSIAGTPESSAVKSKTCQVTSQISHQDKITPPLLVTHSADPRFFSRGNGK